MVCGSESFLGSIHSIADLVSIIVPSYSVTSDPTVNEAAEAWETITQLERLNQPDCRSQQKWDSEICSKEQKLMLENSSSDISTARILANSCKESGAWLNAFPFSTLGTLLDNNSFRIAVALRMGVQVCVPHTCVCGKEVDSYGHHGLYCNKSAGRYARHAMTNDLFKRALVSSRVPATLEPIGCNRRDGKKPDGLTLVPWLNGKPMVWDFTCADTLAKTYIKGNCKNPGYAANKREAFKKDLYQHLEPMFHFIPICVETLGPWGDEGKKLVRKIGAMLKEVSGEKRSTSFLIQRISVAIQKGNAASIMGTVPADSSLEEIFYL